ncbi:MAG: universal stress protein [Candidatus Tectimicrobiota bacterium]
MYGNILVTLDSSGQSEPVLPSLRPLVRQSRSTVHLLSIYPSMRTLVGHHVVVYGHQLEEQATREALRYLEKVATQLRESGLHVSTRVQCGDVVSTLLGLIQTTAVDVLVLPMPWYRGDGRQIPMETTLRLMQRVTIPVLLSPVQTLQPDRGMPRWTSRH